MRILIDHGKDPSIMQFVAAAALTYWQELQGKNNEPLLEKSPIETFCEINGLSADDPIAVKVEAYFQAIQKNRDQIRIMSLL